MKIVRDQYDVVLVGGGIMSVTLAMLLYEFQPDLKIALFERLKDVAHESSSAWNNAGTGHSAFCELNYTPEKNGEIDTSKAETILEQFELSKQLWAYLVDKNYIDSPHDFINTCPHLSIVFGEKDIDFLKKRHQKMKQSHLFSDMEYTEDFEKLRAWMPLIMEHREEKEKIAATKSNLGTDVNFGILTKKILQYLEINTSIEVFREYDVKNIKKENRQWRIRIDNKGEKRTTLADFLFIGAGGYSLTLLNSSKIKEAEGYGGFPVSGGWLVSKNPELIEKHQTKVYTLATVDAPPMSVPHLDLRIIEGEKALLFGPFAGFSTKFLKEGSYFDFFKSINLKNIRSLLGTGIHNIPLTKYLIQQVAMTKHQKIEHLRQFVRNAKSEDWEPLVAGQRVQIIKKDEKKGGKLEFGTEIIVNKERNLATLLGASPGASTSVFAMMQVLEQCFSEQLNHQWRDKLSEILPSYGQKLAQNPELTKKIRDFTKEKLCLKY